ncbi:MAG: GSCFA domain-containing protein, partial [Bryobacteraceae bacterium]
MPTPDLAFPPLNWNAESIQEIVEANPTGEVRKRMGSAFFRGENCNFNPYAVDHQKPNFCEHFLLRGNLPARKIIGIDSQVTAFGSCFAKNITDHLSRLGFNMSRDRAPGIHVSAMGEGLVNVYALLQQFEWALTNVRPPENLWHGFDARSFGYEEAIRQETRRIFLSTDVFILTFGLSEIWYDEATGGIFWRAVPMKFYDASRHKFRVCTFAETKGAIEKIYRLIRSEI